MIVVPPPSGGRVTARGVILALLVLAASGAAGFWAFRHTRAPPGIYASAARPSQASGARPGTVQPATRRPLPNTLPDLSLPDPSGRTRSLSEWKGRPVVVNFWATWCEPCRREIPLLKEILHERAANGLEIIGIALDSAEPVRVYATRQGIEYPILVGERGGLEAADAFGMDTVLPFSVFADRRGEIIGIKIGELHRDEAELILGLLDRVDAGTLTADSARSEVRATLPKLAAVRAGSGNAAAQ